MKHDATHYALLAAGWLVAIVGAAALWREAAALPQAMPLEELQRTVGKLRSDALEAQALAELLAQGQLTTNYAHEQHRRLERDLDNVRKALDKPPPRGHEDDASRARAAVERLDALLKAAPVAMVDAAQLRRLAGENAAVARDLRPRSP